MTPNHPLDRPIWTALTGLQADLAERLPGAVRLDPDVGLFAAAADPAGMDDLAAFMSRYGETDLLEAEATPLAEALPPGATILRQAMLVQMTADALTPGPSVAWEPLGETDSGEVYDLAVLTRPGPFRSRTVRFGGFIGVREGGRLIAMAGTRLRAPGFTEVSAVCTHPDYRGRGLAKALMREVASRIIDAGETAFLHAYADRAATVALYGSLGFEVRQRILYTTSAGQVTQS